MTRWLWWQWMKILINKDQHPPWMMLTLPLVFTPLMRQRATRSQAPAKQPIFCHLGDGSLLSLSTWLSPGWWLIIIEHMINLQSFKAHVFPLPWITKVSPVVAHISWTNFNGQQEIILHYEFDKWFLYWILHLPHPGHVVRNTLRLEMFSPQTQSARSPPAEHLPLDIQTFK